MMKSDDWYHILKAFLYTVGIVAVIGIAFLLYPIVMGIFGLLFFVGLYGLPVWVVVYFVWRARRKKKGLPT